MASKYLVYVFQQGKAIKDKTKLRYIHLNKSDDDNGWDFAHLDHPASFDSFAMDYDKNMEIIKDLIAFKNDKENIIQGLERLGNVVTCYMVLPVLAIIVVEDIDSSLEITRKRKTQNEDDSDDDDGEGTSSRGKSKVTLSGFLNFVDGIWSGSGGERIIVFTTNHVNKLDPALIRRGRMDMHIELSYCTFQAFKVLAKNYLEIDSHPLFETIGGLLGEVNMTPVDVIEHLIRYRVVGDLEACLESLIRALETTRKEKEEKSQGRSC
ncbi:ATPase, AAA-type, core [Corchorus olitorius]|uniref:ATPase, AAA-type, core n=1 Tax=Corchorus olitorius TaxID=93759 RepID=A0A1R3JWF6_9ROSI|nr:ATPase, AAA-type, core [Corchorus olitorius]